MFRSNNLKTAALILTLSVLVLDLFTKWLIYHYMTPYQVIPVIDNFFNIVYAKNFGAAFSFLSTAPAWFRKPFFFIVNLAAMGFIVYIMHRDKDNKRQFLAFASVLGGALGNFVNRIYPGYAIDFLDIKLTSTYHWPSFNVADIAITVGLIIVMLDMAKMESKKKKSAKK